MRDSTFDSGIGILESSLAAPVAKMAADQVDEQRRHLLLET